MLAPMLAKWMSCILLPRSFSFSENTNFIESAARLLPPLSLVGKKYPLLLSTDIIALHVEDMRYVVFLLRWGLAL